MNDPIKILSPANQMLAKQLHWWQKYKPRLIFAGFIALLVGLIAVIFAGYLFNWTWIGANKTLFDWLQLIIIPAALAIIAALYNRGARRNARGIAYDNQREEILQSYLDRMVALLFEKNLNDLQQNANTRMIIRAQTLIVLQRLDPARKECVLQFLYESGITSIIHLSEADLNKSLITPEQLDTAKMRKSLFEN